MTRTFEMSTQPERLAYSEQELKTIYQAVFRQSTVEPGFYYEDLGPNWGSHALRQRMVNLKQGLSVFCERQGGVLHYQSMGRFNQLHSSRFHRDSTDQAHSFLMLGYEPTEIESQVYLGDYSRLIEEEALSLENYLGQRRDVNAQVNDAPLEPYSTALTPFPKRHYRLVLLNNSKSFSEKTLGVFHRAEVSPSASEADRIINYMMLSLRPPGEEMYFDNPAVEHFVNSQKVSR